MGLDRDILWHFSRPEMRFYFPFHPPEIGNLWGMFFFLPFGGGHYGPIQGSPDFACPGHTGPCLPRPWRVGNCVGSLRSHSLEHPSQPCCGCFVGEWPSCRWIWLPSNWWLWFAIILHSLPAWIVLRHHAFGQGWLCFFSSSGSPGFCWTLQVSSVHPLLVQLLSRQQFFSWERCGPTWPRYSAGVELSLVDLYRRVMTSHFSKRSGWQRGFKDFHTTKDVLMRKKHAFIIIL